MDFFLALIAGIIEPLSEDMRTMLIHTPTSNFVSHHAMIDPKTGKPVYTVTYCLN